MDNSDKLDERLKDLLFTEKEIQFLNEKFRSLFLESYLELGKRVKQGPGVFTRQKKLEAIFLKKCFRVIQEMETKSPGIHKRILSKKYNLWTWYQDVEAACIKKLRKRLREKKVRWFDEKDSK